MRQGPPVVVRIYPGARPLVRRIRAWQRWGIIALVICYVAGFWVIGGSYAARTYRTWRAVHPTPSAPVRFVPAPESRQPNGFAETG